MAKDGSARSATLEADSAMALLQSQEQQLQAQAYAQAQAKAQRLANLKRAKDEVIAQAQALLEQARLIDQAQQAEFQLPLYLNEHAVPSLIKSPLAPIRNTPPYGASPFRAPSFPNW